MKFEQRDLKILLVVVLLVLIVSTCFNVYSVVRIRQEMKIVGAFNQINMNTMNIQQLTNAVRTLQEFHKEELAKKAEVVK